MSSSLHSDWTLATTNKGKLAEYRALLSDLSLNLRALDFDSIDPPEETGLSFVENALIKARHASGLTRGPAIADDSGQAITLAVQQTIGVRLSPHRQFIGQCIAQLHRVVDALAQQVGAHWPRFTREHSHPDGARFRPSLRQELPPAIDHLDDRPRGVLERRERVAVDPRMTMRNHAFERLDQLHAGAGLGHAGKLHAQTREEKVAFLPLRP